jgi:uncharacterized protein YndB with AHSA1/START domain
MSQIFSSRFDRAFRRVGAVIGCFTLLGLGSIAAAAPPQVTEAYVNAPVPEVWRLLTTPEGYVLAGATKAEVELKLGGEILTAAPETMVEEILSYEPEHMLSTRIKRLPTSLGLSVVPAGWSVIYLTPLGDTMTQIKRLDFMPADKGGEAVQQFLLQQNRTLFQRLERRYAPKCKLCLKEEAAAK